MKVISFVKTSPLFPFRNALNQSWVSSYTDSHEADVLVAVTTTFFEGRIRACATHCSTIQKGLYECKKYSIICTVRMITSIPVRTGTINRLVLRLSVRLHARPVFESSARPSYAVSYSHQILSNSLCDKKKTWLILIPITTWSDILNLWL